MGVAELVHADQPAFHGTRPADLSGDAFARAFHASRARITTALSDRRELSTGAARQLPASARSAHGAWRNVSASASVRRVHIRRGSRRLADSWTDSLHAPRIGAKQSPGPADTP